MDLDKVILTRRSLILAIVLGVVGFLLLNTYLNSLAVSGFVVGNVVAGMFEEISPEVRAEYVPWIGYLLGSLAWLKMSPSWVHAFALGALALTMVVVALLYALGLVAIQRAIYCALYARDRAECWIFPSIFANWLITSLAGLPVLVAYLWPDLMALLIDRYIVWYMLVCFVIWVRRQHRINMIARYFAT